MAFPPFSSPQNAATPRNSAVISLLIVVIALYSLAFGAAFLLGFINASRASWALVPPPIALAIWYSYGFLQPNTTPNSAHSSSKNAANSAPDFGLLISACGWALTALALVIPRNEIANSNSAAANSAGDVTATICGVIAILCILCGAILSWRAARETL